MNHPVIVNQVWYDTSTQRTYWVKQVGGIYATCSLLFSEEEDDFVLIPFPSFTGGTLKLKRTHLGEHV